MGAPEPQQCYKIKGQPPLVDPYTTRYHVHISSKRLCIDSLLYYYAPCCRVIPRSFSFVRRFLRAESFLYLLHLSTVVIASAKEALSLREQEDTRNTHLILSTVEGTITFCVVVFRMINAVMGLHEVKKALLYRYERNSYIPLDDKSLEELDKNIHLQQVRRYMYLYVAGGLLMLAGGVFTFVALYYWANLGWTFMITNFCLITSAVATSLYNARAELSVARIREDHYRVILLETMTITREMSLDPKGCRKKAQDYRRQLLSTGDLLKTKNTAEIKSRSARREAKNSGGQKYDTRVRLYIEF